MSHSEKKTAGLYTVKELVTALQGCPEDAVVYVGGPDGVAPLSMTHSTEHSEMLIILKKNGHPDTDWSPFPPASLETMKTMTTVGEHPLKTGVVVIRNTADVKSDSVTHFLHDHLKKPAH